MRKSNKPLTIVFSKNISFLFLFTAFYLFGCYAPKKIQPLDTVAKNPTVKIVIESDTAISDVILVPFGGFKLDDYHEYADTVIINFEEPLEGFYQLLAQSNEKFIQNTSWLKGDDILIKASVEDKKLQIDTVINSPFYYYTTEVLAKYTILKTENAEKTVSNSFLLKAIEENIDNQFSLYLTELYIKDNEKDKPQLRILESVVGTQDSILKTNILSYHGVLEHLLKVDTINLSAYKFYTENGDTSTISIDSEELYFIDFWFTDCKPCIADHKKLKALSSKFKAANINIIGISTDHYLSKWQAFLSKNQYDWLNLKEISGADDRLSIDLGLLAFPTYLVVDSNGNLLNKSNILAESITFLTSSNLIEE